MRLVNYIKAWIDYVRAWVVWMLGVMVALLIATPVLWLAFSALNSASLTEAGFVLGVTVATTAAATDGWGHYYSSRAPEQARTLGSLTTVLTWVGIGATCWPSTRSDFGAMPGLQAIEFFGLMSALSVAAGWFFALVSRRQPRRPRRPAF